MSRSPESVISPTVEFVVLAVLVALAAIALAVVL